MNIKIGLTIILGVILAVDSQDIKCESSGACYRYESTARTQADAASVCQGHGGNLVSVFTSNLQTELQSVMSHFGATESWLRGKREQFTGDYGFDWKWVSTRQNIRDIGCYSENPLQWASPNEVTSAVNAAGTFTAQGCENACQNFQYFALQYGNRCYCTNNYGRNPHVNSYEQSDKVCKKKCQPDGLTACGADRSDVANIGKVGGTFSVWGYQQPNNYRGNQLCGAIKKGWGEFKNDDMECKENNYYMCEINTLNCAGEGGSTVAGKCVTFSSDTKNWFESQETCVLKGGNLIAVDSLTLWEALKSKIQADSTLDSRGHWWIGLVALEWYWDPNNKLVYTIWDTEEPSIGTDPNQQRECIQSTIGNTYRWSSRECSRSSSFLCQVTAPSTTTTTTTTTRPTTTTTTTRATTTTTTPRTTTTPTTTTPRTTTTTTRGSGTTPTTTTAKGTTPTQATTTTTSRGGAAGGSSTTTASTTTSTATTRATASTTTTTSPGAGATTTTTRAASGTTTTSPKTTTAQTTTTVSGNQGNNGNGNQGSGNQGNQGGQTTSSSSRGTTGITTTRNPNAIGNNAPSAGKSTGSVSSGLGILEIILIVICVLLVILVIALIAFIAYYKRNKERNRIDPNTYDARGKAPYGYEGYDGAEHAYYTGSEGGSQTGLVPGKKHGSRSASKAGKISIDDEY